MIKILLQVTDEDCIEIFTEDSERSKLESAIQKNTINGDNELLKIKNYEGKGYTLIRSDCIVMYVFLPESYVEEQKKKAKEEAQLKQAERKFDPRHGMKGGN